MIASSDLHEAIAASLANPGHAWRLQSASDTDHGNNTRTKIATLESAYLGAQIIYVAHLGFSLDEWHFLSAEIMIAGTSFQSYDAVLFDGAIDPMIVSHLAGRDAALAKAFTPPVATIFPYSIASAVSFGIPTVG